MFLEISVLFLCEKVAKKIINYQKIRCEFRIQMASFSWEKIVFFFNDVLSIFRTIHVLKIDFFVGFFSSLFEPLFLTENILGKFCGNDSMKMCKLFSKSHKGKKVKKNVANEKF